MARVALSPRRSPAPGSTACGHRATRWTWCSPPSPRSCSRSSRAPTRPSSARPRPSPPRCSRRAPTSWSWARGGPRQRRRRGDRHRAGRHGRQRPAVERALGRRAHWSPCWALARNIPRPTPRWSRAAGERSKWEGIELSDKVLGVIGLGRIGKLVAQRASAFGMRLVAYDPFLPPRAGPPDQRRAHGARRAHRRAGLHHAARGQDARDHRARRQSCWPRPSRACGSSTWPGDRGRGGAGRRHPQRSHRRRRPRRVRGPEPTTESPLFELDEVVVAPTWAPAPEAQDKAGDTIAEQVWRWPCRRVRALRGERERRRGLRRPCARSRPGRAPGQLFAGLCEASPVLEVEYQGKLAESDTRILTLSALEGPVRRTATSRCRTSTPPHRRGARRGGPGDLAVGAQDFVNLITLPGGGHAIAGTLGGSTASPHRERRRPHRRDPARRPPCRGAATTTVPG